MTGQEYQALVLNAVGGLTLHHDMLHGAYNHDGIHCPHITDQWSALVALHELGHHVLHREQAQMCWLGRAVWEDYPDVIEYEVEAWEFARKVLGEPLLPETQERIRHCLDTYFTYARRREMLRAA